MFPVVQDLPAVRRVFRELTMDDRPQHDPARKQHRIRFLGREVWMPRSRLLRIVVGVLLILLGMFGFLPVLGFWMIPLGLLVLSVDLPIVRRWRRQLTVWWHRKRGEPVEEAEANAESAKEKAPK